MKNGLVTNIQRYSVNDGTGIRTIVFFKGCPLRCKWCHNPETLIAHPELMLFPGKCIGCRRCVKACVTGAVTENEYNRTHCVNCGKCCALCPTGAVELAGEWLSVDELLKEIKKDNIFYQLSGGGVTLSGGEPLFQSEFAFELVQRLRDGAYTVAIETSGFAAWDEAKKVLDFVDEILFDVKVIDEKKHLMFTGVSNALILKNAKKAAGLGKKMCIRVPVVGGVNNTEGEIGEIGNFALNIGVNTICLLPYHNLGEAKYQKLGFRSDNSFYTPSDGEMENFRALLEHKGLNATIEGH